MLTYVNDIHMLMTYTCEYANLKDDIHMLMTCLQQATTFYCKRKPQGHEHGL